MLLPDIGKTCLYTFVPKFEKLDGIYTLLSKMPYSVAIDEHVDFIESLYTPAGISDPKDAFNADWNSYSNSNVGKLQHVEDPSKIIYCPENIIRLVPNPMVREYNKLYLAIDIGVHDDVEKLAWLKAQIDDIAACVTGTASSTKVMRSGTAWMSLEEYMKIEEARKDRYAHLDTTYAALQKQIAETQSLKTKIKNYEELLKSLSIKKDP